MADVLDALTTDRVYRNALPWDYATRRIVEGAGSHFDPDVIAVLLDATSEILVVRREHEAA